MSIQQQFMLGVARSENVRIWKQMLTWALSDLDEKGHTRPRPETIAEWFGFQDRGQVSKGVCHGVLTLETLHLAMAKAKPHDLATQKSRSCRWQDLDPIVPLEVRARAGYMRALYHEYRRQLKEAHSPPVLKETAAKAAVTLRGWTVDSAALRVIVEALFQIDWPKERRAEDQGKAEADAILARTGLDAQAKKSKRATRGLELVHGVWLAATSVLYQRARGKVLEDAPEPFRHCIDIPEQDLVHLLRRILDEDWALRRRDAHPEREAARLLADLDQRGEMTENECLQYVDRIWTDWALAATVSFFER